MKLAGLVASLLLCALAAHAEFDHSYVKLNRVLRRHVQQGMVDYAALKSAPKDLDAALDEMAAVKEAEFEQWPKSQQVAFLINLYNASTLRLIVTHYPIRSIKDIGNLLRGPFKQRIVRLLGETTTLDHVEHGMLRANYREPRIHFALVCAAKSCPPLRPEPYVSSRLDAQLDDQGRAFLGDRTKNRLEAGGRVLYLSPIFKWFSEDFGQDSGSIVKFIGPFLPAEARKQVETMNPVVIRHLDYDWSLNKITR